MKIAVSLLVTFVFLTQRGFSQGLFPLNTDNRWQLEDADPMNYHLLDSRVIGDTTFENGHRYKVVEPYGVAGATYVRQEEQVLFAYFPPDSTETPFFDFAADVGDTIGIWLGYYWITLESKGPTTFYGRTFMSWIFRIGLLADVTVIDSVGVTHMILEPGITFNFRGAIIDGVQYGTITSVPWEAPGFPESASLSQNYPNPFNPTTTIRFSVGTYGHMSLRVYDLLGREVATLVNERLLPGRYTRQWDAIGLSSGVYYYRLSANGVVQTRKLLLLR